MRSTNKLTLMILSTITLILITESQGTILSKEKKKELEKQLMDSKSGFREKLEFMSAGWIVSPKLNQNHSGIFISWRTNGKICYNTLCPGFVQVSRIFALGHLVKPASTYNGQQYILEVFMFLEGSGNWWLVIKGEPIGYWPGSLFNANGLRYEADRVYWGGEVFSAVRPSISPFMGSGYFPRDGFGRAAYINGLRVLEPVTKKVTIPSPKTFTFYANSPNCYNVKARSGVGERWSSYIFFGGPGGCTN